jgi:recombinational DNA repair protein RecT
MAKKTVLKQLLSKYAPMSVLMAEGIKVDQAVLGSDKVDYVDNETEETGVVEEAEMIPEETVNKVADILKGDGK